MMIGSKLAHYEITAHLGTGGMGEVYQATDTKLGRSVAIKLLPDAFTHDAGRTERFELEADSGVCGWRQFPALVKAGWPRHQENVAKLLIWSGRGGSFNYRLFGGLNEPPRLHPLRRLHNIFLMGAATPP